MPSFNEKWGSATRNPAVVKWTFVLLLSAIVGAWLGAFYFSTWQAAVETAQVHAGIVEYPRDNPFNHYHLKAWSLLHNLLAPLLWAGVSEFVLSIALSAVLCALVFMLLASITFVLSENVAVSLLAPVSMVAMYLHFSIHGPVYPLVLAGTYHTYGVLGRIVALAILIALATRCFRLGGFLIALAPALHLTWGAWAAGVALIVLAFEFRSAKQHLKPTLQGFAAGAAVPGASFAYFYFTSRGLPAIPPEEQKRYLDAFAAWDPHRIPVHFLQPGAAMLLASTVLSGLWLWRYRATLSISQTFLLRAFLVSGVLAIVAAALTWVPGLPPIVQRLMPGRFVNLSILVFAPLLLGLLGQRADWPAKLLLALHVLYIPISTLRLDGTRPAIRDWYTVHWIELVVVAILLALITVWKLPQAQPRKSLREWVPAAALLALLAFLPGHLDAVLSRPHPRQPVMPLLGSAPDTTLTATAAGNGLLIIAPDLRFKQLKTRRPLLLSSALNQLPYVPDSAPAMDRILKEVYDVDLLVPPPVTTHQGVHWYLTDHTKRAWEARSLEEWIAIRQTFGATQVLTREDWNLNLPQVAESDRYHLFDIPAGRRSRPEEGRRRRTRETSRSGR